MQETELEDVVADTTVAGATETTATSPSVAETTTTSPSVSDATSQMNNTYMEGRRHAMLMAVTAVKIIFEPMKTQNECLSTLCLPEIVYSDANSVVCCIKDTEFPKFPGLFYLLEIIGAE